MDGTGVPRDERFRTQPEGRDQPGRARPEGEGTERHGGQPLSLCIRKDREGEPRPRARGRTLIEVLDTRLFEKYFLAQTAVRGRIRLEACVSISGRMKRQGSARDSRVRTSPQRSFHFPNPDRPRTPRGAVTSMSVRQQVR